MKNLSNLKGVKTLSKKQQKSVNGGVCYLGNTPVWCPVRCFMGQCLL